MMTNFRSLLYLASIFLCLILFESNRVFAQDEAEENVLRQAEQMSGDSFTVSAKTPKGAKIYGVKKPEQAMIDAIDKGLTDLFAVARKNNYSAKLNYSDYIIFIASPDRINDADGNYSPGFSIPVRQYAGSVYDKGGYMYVAGMVISNNPCAFLITDYDRELNRVSDVVRYEGEHLVLYHNDRKRYTETADHSQGGGHPILN